MAEPVQRAYGDVSLIEIGKLILAIFRLPFVLAWSLLVSKILSSGHSKSWRRVLGDTAFRFLSLSLNITQFQFALGTTRQVYEKWTKQNGLPSLVEEIGEDACLLWIGPKRTEHVILYFHGGGYLLPLQDFAASFWNYVRVELKAQARSDVGFVVFSYSLVPTAVFPTQLRQATLAIQHIISSGVKPENIQIVGDSAGANLALSLLSHMLHPLEGVPHLSLTSRIRGVYLMSPWTSLTGDTGSHLVNDKSDIVGAKTFGYCGRKVFAGVPESRYPYLEASKVPDSWFKGIDRLVGRVLITAGGAECLRDDIAQLSRKIAEHHPEATFIVHAGGIHNDPYYDFLAGETNLCELTLRILNWLAQGLS